MAEMDRDELWERLFFKMSPAEAEQVCIDADDLPVLRNALHALVTEQRAEARREAAEEIIGIMHASSPEDTKNDYVTEGYFKRANKVIADKFFDGVEDLVAFAPLVGSAEEEAKRVYRDLAEDVADRIEKNEIKSGSIGPLMDAGWNMANKCSAGMIRAAFHLDAREEADRG